MKIKGKERSKWISTVGRKSSREIRCSRRQTDATSPPLAFMIYRLYNLCSTGYPYNLTLVETSPDCLWLFNLFWQFLQKGFRGLGSLNFYNYSIQFCSCVVYWNTEVWSPPLSADVSHKHVVRHFGCEASFIFYRIFYENLYFRIGNFFFPAHLIRSLDVVDV